MKFIKSIIALFLPFFRQYKLFSKACLLSNYKDFLLYKLGLRKRYWPAHSNCTIAHEDRIFVGINSVLGRSGNYIQGVGGIYIGNYTRLAVNVGVLSSNHDLYNHNVSHKEKVVIGDYCWVGMNSVILPGVILGTRTIVAAGSVVTKSFPEGFCVLGGVPAKIIKRLDPEKFIPWHDEVEYYGFVPKSEFEKSEFYKANYPAL